MGWGLRSLLDMYCTYIQLGIEVLLPNTTVTSRVALGTEDGLAIGNVWVRSGFGQRRICR